MSIPIKNNHALPWLMLSLFMFATGDAVAKLLGRSFPVLGAVWLRYIIPTLLLGGYLIRQRGIKFAPTQVPKLQFLRGVCLVISTALFWTALKYLPLAEAAAVAFIGPSLVVVMSSVILGEHARPIHWVSLAMGFTGVLIVLRPGFENPGVGAIASLCSAFMYGLYQVLTRKVSQDDPLHSDILTQLFYANATGAVILSSFVPFSSETWRMPVGYEWLGIAGICTLSILGHVGNTKAYSLTAAPNLAPFMYVQLLYVSLYGWFIFNQFPDGYTLLGMLVIIGSGLVVLFDAREKGKEEPSPTQHPE